MGNQGSFKGDVARSVLFLQLRYNGLSVVNGFPSVSGQMGDLTTLLDWHRNDPPDDFEMNRNNVVYTWQFNRNPLIDMPDLVEYIWGNNVGDVWNNSLSTPTFEKDNFVMYPNPASNKLYISGLQSQAKITIYSTEGRKVLSKNFSINDRVVNLNLSSGLYLVNISTEKTNITKKLQVK